MSTEIHLTYTQTHGLSLRLVLQNEPVLQIRADERPALLSGQCQWKQRDVVFGPASMSERDRAGWVSGSAGGLIGH